MWTNRRMDKRMKNGQTNRQNFTNFERNLAMMVIYLPVKVEFDQTDRFELESGNENVDGQMDGQKNGQTDRKTDKQTDGITPVSKGI